MVALLYLSRMRMDYLSTSENTYRAQPVRLNFGTLKGMARQDYFRWISLPMTRFYSPVVRLNQSSQQVNLTLTELVRYGTQPVKVIGCQNSQSELKAKPSGLGWILTVREFIMRKHLHHNCTKLSDGSVLLNGRLTFPNIRTAILTITSTRSAA